MLNVREIEVIHIDVRAHAHRTYERDDDRSIFPGRGAGLVVKAVLGNLVRTCTIT